MTSFLKQAREWASPTLKTSAFLSRGVLTPEEFVRAGDELVFKCPTWSWEGGESSKLRKHLPPEKQYLVTRNVPCVERVATMEGALLGETEVEIPADDDDDDDEDGKEGGGWLVSHVADPSKASSSSASAVAAAEGEKKVEDEFDFVTMNEDGEGEIVSSKDYNNSKDAQDKKDSEEAPPAPAPSQQLKQTTDNEEEEDEYGDMADFEDDNIQDDEALAPVVTSPTTTTSPSASSSKDNIRRVRTYDISITYDKYYQTPRVWIFGYHDDGTTPLTPDQMFQDVMTDYVRRTVTIESHPHVAGPHLSIHPCQHGAVMKNIVRNLTKKSQGEEEEGKGGPEVEMYMFIFLKFVSSIVPTMNYDFTTEVTASTEKS